MFILHFQLLWRIPVDNLEENKNQICKILEFYWCMKVLTEVDLERSVTALQINNVLLSKLLQPYQIAKTAFNTYNYIFKSLNTAEVIIIYFNIPYFSTILIVSSH